MTSYVSNKKLEQLSIITTTSLILSVALLNGCSSDSPPQNEVNLEVNAATEPKPDAVVRVSTNEIQSPASSLKTRLADLLALSELESANLANATDAFTREPSEEAFVSLVLQYESAHQAYRLARVAALLDASATIDDQHIDDAPMLPGYLDSVEGYPSSGVIHSELPIDITMMLQEYKFSDELYLTLGFHPYEFILKGDASSPVAAWRRFNEEGTEKHSLAAERRRTYLSLLANTLHKDISERAALWRQSATIDATKLDDEMLKEQVLEDERAHSGKKSAQAIASLWDDLDKRAKSDKLKQKSAKQAVTNEP